jgi:hypothetical protein
MHIQADHRGRERGYMVKKCKQFDRRRSLNNINVAQGQGCSKSMQGCCTQLPERRRKWYITENVADNCRKGIARKRGIRGWAVRTEQMSSVLQKRLWYRCTAAGTVCKCFPEVLIATCEPYVTARGEEGGGDMVRRARGDMKGKCCG